VGNNDLKPEKMLSFELALSYLLTENFSIGSSIYRNLIRDKLTIEHLDSGDRWINKDKLNTLGFELYGNYSANDFSLYANYTYTDSYDQNDSRIPEISAHTANAGITYSFNTHIKINLKANFTGERNNPAIIPSTGNNIIDDALLLHGCISFLNLSGFDFQLKIDNILNQEYYHPSNRFAGRYRQPQRTITLKSSYVF
jgi:outer membrane receptor for ferrienterochelin and colicin